MRDREKQILFNSLGLYVQIKKRHGFLWILNDVLSNDEQG